MHYALTEFHEMYQIRTLCVVTTFLTRAVRNVAAVLSETLMHRESVAAVYATRLYFFLLRRKNAVHSLHLQ